MAFIFKDGSQKCYRYLGGWRSSIRDHNAGNNFGGGTPFSFQV
jgi:hypothetical protein